MKKLKFFAYVLTLLMCTSLTSCLSTDDTDPGYEAVLQVYVDNLYGTPYFRDAAGNMLFPTSESLAYFNQNGYDLSDYDMLIIYFNYEESSDAQRSETSTTPQTYYIELVAFQPMEVPETIGVQTVEDMEVTAPETAPMLTLRLTSSLGAIAPYMFDDRTAVAYTGFWLTNEQDMLEKHTVRLVYVYDEIEPSSEDLVVYLRHDKGEDDGVEVYYANYYGLNLQAPLSYFRGVTGHDPENIIIKAKECTYSTTSLPTEYSTSEIEYKSSTAQ